MKRSFPHEATVWREGNWYVSQCLELDVASQGETEEEALANVREALELHLEEPQATVRLSSAPSNLIGQPNRRPRSRG
jgi:predicted RNase H-like HicB family nuclease